MCLPNGIKCVNLWSNSYITNTYTVPVRKMFPTVEYFFYGDTLSTNISTRTTLCYGSGIQRTAQYVSTYQRCHDYMAQNVRDSFKAAGTCVCTTKRPNSTTRTTRSMFTCTSLLCTHSYGLTLRCYATIIKLRGT